MSDVGDFLFGSTDTNVNQASTLTGGQSQLLDQLTALLQGQLGTGVDAYPGTTVAPESGLQTQSFDILSNLLSGASDGNMNSNTNAVIQRLLSGDTSVPDINVQPYDVGEFDPTAIQDWYQGALVNPALQTWQEDVVPVINESFIGQNAASSGAAPRAIAESAQDLMSGLNTNLANTLFGEKQAYDTRQYESGMDYINKLFQAETTGAGMEFEAGQSDLNRLLNVPGFESNQLSNLLNLTTAGQTAGETQRGITGQGLTEDYTKWLTEQGYNNPWLTQFLNTVLGTNAFENLVQQENQSGLLSLIAPVAGSYLGTGSGSDWLTSLLN